MIIPKESKLTDEQLSEVTEIVEEYGCRVQPIIGHHRTIYAILGEERRTLMVNRIMGLTYIDRFDAIDSPFKLMDIHSELSNHTIKIGSTTVGEDPVIIAGHCTIDPKNPGLFYESAHAIKEAGATALRGGVWKPRTMPYSFQGDHSSIDILIEAREQTGLPVDTEVMDEEQLKIAVDAGVDILPCQNSEVLIGEINAFGDLLPNLTDRSESAYEAIAHAALNGLNQGSV